MNNEPGKMALGIAVGVGVGAAIGTALGDVPVGIAIGIALGLAPSGMMAFTTDNCSVTRLDILQNHAESGWRVLMINHQPWVGVPQESKLA